MQSGPTNKCKFYRWNVYAQARGPPYPLYYYCQISCETISYGILLLATASLHIMHNIKEYCHHNTINSWSSKTLTYMRLVRHLNVKFSLFCLKNLHLKEVNQPFFVHRPLWFWSCVRRWNTWFAQYQRTAQSRMAHIPPLWK